jgi:hypothetical protein
MTKLITVRDYIERLKQFPDDWRVEVSTSAGGGISVEHREIDGEPVVAVFGSNGGRFGENPLTEEEYRVKSMDFANKLASGLWHYTTIHGDHRLYLPGGVNDTCYGTHYDERIIDRMVYEGKLAYFKQSYSRDGVRLTARWFPSEPPSS